MNTTSPPASGDRTALITSSIDNGSLRIAVSRTGSAAVSWAFGSWAFGSWAFGSSVDGWSATTPPSGCPGTGDRDGADQRDCRAGSGSGRIFAAESWQSPADLLAECVEVGAQGGLVVPLRLPAGGAEPLRSHHPGVREIVQLAGG